MEVTETDPQRNVGCTGLASELDFVPAARLPTPTPVVTYFDDVIRSETTTMVLRSHIRGGRSSAMILEMELQPEIETEPEVEIATEMEITVSSSSSSSSLKISSAPIKT